VGVELDATCWAHDEISKHTNKRYPMAECSGFCYQNGGNFNQLDSLKMTQTSDFNTHIGFDRKLAITLE
jgi:hypothetical protein